eukprot:758766-Hanusia_phi.AAC.1
MLNQRKRNGAGRGEWRGEKLREEDEMQPRQPVANDTWWWDFDEERSKTIGCLHSILVIILKASSEQLWFALGRYQKQITMALNPPLIPGQGLPLPVHGELFILQRSDVRFEAEVVGQVSLVESLSPLPCFWEVTLRLVQQTKRTYDHKGNLYLSTLRMVFVKDSNDTVNRGWFGLGPEHASDLIVKYDNVDCETSPDMCTLPLKAYDIPLSLLHKERFNQPIFGCNNIEAVCLPLPGTDGETHVKLSFYSGSYIFLRCEDMSLRTFLSGGVGTFLPLFFDLLNRNR